MDFKKVPFHTISILQCLNHAKDMEPYSYTKQHHMLYMLSFYTVICVANNIEIKFKQKVNLLLFNAKTIPTEPMLRKTRLIFLAASHSAQIPIFS